MALEEVVAAGVRNAFARTPAVDRETIEGRLRRANRSVGRRLGRVEWLGSFEAYIRRSAELLVDGWTLDVADPLTPPQDLYFSSRGRSRGDRRLERLVAIERELWATERASHVSSRVTPARRLPVHLNAIEEPALAAPAAVDALETSALALKVPGRREPGFASDKYWKWDDPHWRQTQAIAAVPFLAEVTHCFADGLLTCARWRRSTETRTILVGRPQLRLRGGRLHRSDEAAVVWPDGTERWYWQGIAVPANLVAARDDLSAARVASIQNQELRRVALERLGWQQFLETADAELAAQDDFGKLWSTRIDLEGERVRLVEVVNASAEPDGSYRRYFLRVPPQTRTAREAVAWTFGFNNADDYLIAEAS